MYAKRFGITTDRNCKVKKISRDKEGKWLVECFGSGCEDYVISAFAVVVATGKHRIQMIIHVRNFRKQTLKLFIVQNLKMKRHGQDRPQLFAKENCVLLGLEIQHQIFALQSYSQPVLIVILKVPLQGSISQ
mmetsp:Transcript_13148/g.19126  ORF Transcript_13148/g.19126 Transcript_13148/m.19126 type:complete len:132 (-) Transcript_13148:591-986(-)